MSNHLWLNNPHHLAFKKMETLYNRSMYTYILEKLKLKLNIKQCAISKITFYLFSILFYFFFFTVTYFIMQGVDIC